MPLYEYECQSCKKIFEVLQRINEDAQKLTCPRCHADSPRRIFSTFSTGSSSGGSCSPEGFT